MCSRHFQLNVALPLTLTEISKSISPFQWSSHCVYSPLGNAKKLVCLLPFCSNAEAYISLGPLPRRLHAVIVPLTQNHVVIILLKDLLAFKKKEEKN